jgi:HSP20 family molecular chaperone IbpA
VFHVEFDANGYRPEDISVHVTGSRLTVHGVRRETDDPEELKVRKDAGGLRRTTTEFCRRIRLPDDVDRAGLTCVIVSGQVIIEAPRLVPCRPAAADRSPTESVRTPRAGGVSCTDRASPLNTPMVRVSADGTVREVLLSVEVGRLFRPDDVTVKVKNSTLTLTVVAERVERSPLTSTTRSSPGEDAIDSDNLVGGGISDVAAGGSWRRLNANLTWEFDLPGAVEMDTLKAGLTMDGLLKITATMKQQSERNESADKVEH